MTSKLPHKNAKGIAKAYACYRKAASTPLPMTVIGVEGVETEGITWIGYVERDEDLHQMLHNAKAFLFLSLVEGFGFKMCEPACNQSCKKADFRMPFDFFIQNCQ